MYNRMIASLKSCHCALCAVSRVDVKLRKYRGILHHGTQAADQPRQIRREVLLLSRMTQDAGSIGSVAHQRQDEEQQRESYSN